MPLRPPGEGRRAAPSSNKLLLAFAVILLPWLPIANAQQQQRHRVNANANSHHQPAAAPYSQPNHRGHGSDDPIVPVPVPGWADDVEKRRPFTSSSSLNSPHQQQNKYSNDESALETLAPALKAVRAPNPSRNLGTGGSSSSPASGLASPQNARNLRDWEVEDFVLLATVDGDLYANDRKTGQERWHLEVDQPMVETTHHRANSSVLDEDYNPVDHYIWAVEPNNDGGLYLWNPEAPAPLRTGFTMKRLVESMVPYASDDPPVVYTGKKETTMITLDAATGRVLKWFSSSGSHVNEAESCLQQNTLYDRQSEECSSSTGTITLGRTEYTVGIQRIDGRPVATLKYSEWGPNRFDNDLYQQYHATLDDRYITSQPDGRIYAFDYRSTGKPDAVFSTMFTSPVARVLDVCRPLDAPADNLVVLPQPSMPAPDDDMAKMHIFLNHTESGSWYAMSGRAYPLITHAPLAQISRPDWSQLEPSWDTISEAKLSRALVGTHYLGNVVRHNGQPLSLPPGTKLDEEVGDVDTNNDPSLPSIIVDRGEMPNIITTFKALPKSAANSVVSFISNPILIILLVSALFYHEKKLRQSYHRFRATGSLKEALLFLTSDGTESIRDDASTGDHEVYKPEQSRLVSEPAGADKTAAPRAADEDLAKTPSPKEPEVIDGTSALSGDEAAKEKSAGDDQAVPSKDVDAPQNQTSDSAGAATEAPQEKVKKKAHRGRRGGVKHRKNRAREGSQSRGDDAAQTTVEDAVRNAKKLGDRPSLEPDVMTVDNDVQAVSGPIIRMGNIEVNMDDQLGTGSNGTLVFAGKFDGREVAVKRMLIQFYDIASQETRLLRESDDHPNVIRYYSQQMRDGFLYIALERCAASLADVVEKPHVFRDLANAGRLDLPGVLYQITNGISHLHQLRIVHRDLKPQNILVNMGKDGKPRLLVSDFGLCKKLEGGQSSFGATTGRAAGTSGWRAPELLLDDDARDAGVVDISTHSGSGSVLVNDHLSPNSRRATRAIDIFSLGLVFFYVLTNGSHPFDCGDRYMREVNIRKGNYNLRPLDSLGDFAYEAEDLIESMLQADPKRRPNAREVMSHPFFWSAKKRLAFLCDVSDHFEKEPRDPPSAALMELERHAPAVTKGDFLRQLPRDFVDSLGKQRKYTGSKLLDLLRALRNKRNHYEDMPDGLKRTVGPLPDGYLAFWTVRFPQLLLVCWNVVYNVQWEETDRFREYYIPAGL